MLQHQFEIRVGVPTSKLDTLVPRFLAAIANESIIMPADLEYGGLRLSSNGEEFGTGEIQTGKPDIHMLRVAYVLVNEPEELGQKTLPPEIESYVRAFLAQAEVVIPDDYVFEVDPENHTLLHEGRRTNDPVVVEALKPILA